MRLHLVSIVLLTHWFLCVGTAAASHQEQGSHAGHAHRESSNTGYPVPGASFHVVLNGWSAEAAEQLHAEPVLRTVIDALALLVRDRTKYPRVDESLENELLRQVVIEPSVVNQEGKTFPFLVARTDVPGRVRLLISAASLNEKGYVHHPKQLAPVLAREFQWVVSKADTAPKQKQLSVERNLARAPIRRDQDIAALSGEERLRLLEQLLGTYLKTVDDHNSLAQQPAYELGTTILMPPTQPDSTTKLYDVRVREALQTIVRDPSFMGRTPNAVRSLLNGKIWNVSYVDVQARDWATRTRVMPEEKAVVVGEPGRTIQPAAVLVNLHRTASPDDPFYRETQGLPMGALSTEQLAHVIALEIEGNIVEKSMRGHVAQDELTAPR